MKKQKSDILNCCKVQAIVPVDGRGQMVLPKEIREKADIKAGDKLAIVTGEQNGQVCLIALIKAEQLEETVESMLKMLGGQTRK